MVDLDLMNEAQQRVLRIVTRRNFYVAFDYWGSSSSSYVTNPHNGKAVPTISWKTPQIQTLEGTVLRLERFLKSLRK